MAQLTVKKPHTFVQGFTWLSIWSEATTKLPLLFKVAA